MSIVGVAQAWARAVCIEAKKNMRPRTVETAQRRNSCFITIPPLAQESGTQTPNQECGTLCGYFRVGQFQRGTRSAWRTQNLAKKSVLDYETVNLPTIRWSR